MKKKRPKAQLGADKHRMGRPSKLSAERRTERIVVRLTKAEKARLEAQARKKGLALAAFILSPDHATFMLRQAIGAEIENATFYAERRLRLVEMVGGAGFEPIRPQRLLLRNHHIKIQNPRKIITLPIQSSNSPNKSTTFPNRAKGRQ